MKLSGNKILVTGGGSGIGLGLTERFVREGNAVIICGRREDVLKEVAGKHSEVLVKQCDLSIPAERKALFEWIAADHSDLNVLVNNAGIQQWMSVTDEDFFERAETEITTNIEAPIHLTNLFLSLDSLDTIINVTSGLAFVPLAKVANYSATKAYFHSFTVSLRYLLKDRGIEVIEMIPPAINTDLGGKGIHDFAPPVSDFVEEVFQQLKEGREQLTFGHSKLMSDVQSDKFDEIFEMLQKIG